MNEDLAALKALLLGSRPRRTLAVAESMTGGRLQARLTEISGASEFFLGGVTAYALDQKVAVLGVDRAHAAAVNCVSAQVAGEMALGVCRLFGADLGVATTGYAEPAPALGVTVPFAWIALAQGAAVRRCWRWEGPGATRVEAQSRVAAAALAGLIAGLREEGPRGADPAGA